MVVRSSPRFDLKVQINIHHYVFVHGGSVVTTFRSQGPNKHTSLRIGTWWFGRHHVSISNNKLICIITYLYMVVRSSPRFDHKVQINIHHYVFVHGGSVVTTFRSQSPNKHTSLRIGTWWFGRHHVSITKSK